MTDFLDALLSRTANAQTGIRPRPLARFEPASPNAGTIEDAGDAQSNDANEPAADRTLHNEQTTPRRRQMVEPQRKRRPATPRIRTIVPSPAPISADAPATDPSTPDRQWVSRDAVTDSQSTPARLALEGEADERPLTPEVRVQPLQPADRELISSQPRSVVDQPASPTINVTIGRVEVRAVTPAQRTAPPAKPSAPPLNLTDYLERRKEGSG